MRIRVTRTARSSSSTHSRAVNGFEPPEVVEGQVVLYRPPALDGRARFAVTGQGVEETVQSAKRLAVLYGVEPRQSLWVSSVVISMSSMGSGWSIVTESGSRYSVEVLAEGATPRVPRRNTGSFPIYDPTPTS